MANRIAEAIEKQGFNKHSFSEHCGVPYGTLYRVCNDEAKIDKITIDNFLKIAHGLGMTAEELYYGKPLERTYSDPRQGRINEQYDGMNERGKEQAADSVENVYANAKNRKSAAVAELDPESAARRTA